MIKTMKRLMLATAVCLAITGTATARQAESQEAPPQTESGTQEPSASLDDMLAAAPAEDEAVVRLRLAERYAELSQGDSIAELSRNFVDQMLAQETQATDEQRAWFRDNLPREMASLASSLMERLAPIFAERLTIEELEALIAFYETPMGQSIVRKQVQIGMEQGVAMEMAILQFQIEMMQKFCTAFDCGAPPPQVSTSGKRTP